MPLHIDDKTTMNYKMPLTIQDGNMIGITPQGNGQILFYQVRKQTGDHIDAADIVAAIHVPNIQALKDFGNAINNVVTEYEKHEA